MKTDEKPRRMGNKEHCYTPLFVLKAKCNWLSLFLLYNKANFCEMCPALPRIAGLGPKVRKIRRVPTILRGAQTLCITCDLTEKE